MKHCSIQHVLAFNWQLFYLKSTYKVTLSKMLDSVAYLKVQLFSWRFIKQMAATIETFLYWYLVRTFCIISKRIALNYFHCFLIMDYLGQIYDTLKHINQCNIYNKNLLIYFSFLICSSTLWEEYWDHAEWQLSSWSKRQVAR